MEVRFFTFHKKENSTSRPVGKAEIWDTSEVYDCVLLEPCSIMSPIIKLDTKYYDEEGNFVGRTVPTRFNYCMIREFSIDRFYNILDIEADHGLWVISLQEDVLATFSVQIQNLTTLVTRSTKFRNQFLADTLFPASYRIMRDTQDLDWTNSDLKTSPRDGTYILSVLNKQATAGTMSYYAMTWNQFLVLKQFLFDMQVYDQNNEVSIGDTLTKMLFNPAQYIAGLMYFPLDISRIVNPLQIPQAISLSWWDMTLNGNSPHGYALDGIPEYKRHYIGRVWVGKHPQAGKVDVLNITTHAGVAPFDGRGQYLNFDPFSKFTLYIQPFGTIQFDSDWIGNILSKPGQVSTDGGFYLALWIDVDVTTGTGCLHMTPDLPEIASEDLYFPIPAQYGIDIPLGQTSSDTIGATTSFINTTGSAYGRFKSEEARGLKSSAAARKIQGWLQVATGIFDALDRASPKLSISASRPGFTTYIQSIFLVSEYYELTENNPEQTGFPLMMTYKLERCKPGFVQTQFSNLDIENSIEPEREYIMSYLNAGVYIED